MSTPRPRVLVTGSRDWTDRAVIRVALEAITDRAPIIIEGGARGADRIARQEARRLGLENETFPADWRRYGKAAGPIRNQAMLDSGIDLCLAFPTPASKGTFDMMRRCREAGVRVVDGFEALL